MPRAIPRKAAPPARPRVHRLRPAAVAAPAPDHEPKAVKPKAPFFSCISSLNGDWSQLVYRFILLQLNGLAAKSPEAALPGAHEYFLRVYSCDLVALIQNFRGSWSRPRPSVASVFKLFP